MNDGFSLKNRDVSAKIAANKLRIRCNAFAFVMLVFVAVAAMQAVQLGNLRAEAKAVSEDVRGIRAQHQLLRAQYTTYENNLSYYFEG